MAPVPRMELFWCRRNKEKPERFLFHTILIWNMMLWPKGLIFFHRKNSVEKGRAKDWGSRTDWYDALLNKDNIGQNHNIALSGGSESSIFRISANYRTKEGIDISTFRKEYGLCVQVLSRLHLKVC